MDMNKGSPDESVTILNSTYLQLLQSNIKSRTMSRTFNFMIFTLIQLPSFFKDAMLVSND